MKIVLSLLVLVSVVTLMPGVAPAARDDEPQAPRSADGLGTR